jgi:nicotinamidase-related amidase
VAEFLPEVAPEDDEIIVNKTASGVFVSTNLEYLLRNLCVSRLYVVGVYTNECISSAVRSAADLGFLVHLISDATAAITQELHEATLVTTKDRYAKVLSTEETIRSCQKAGTAN